MKYNKAVLTKTYVNLNIESEPQKNFLNMHSRDGDVVWHFNKLPYPFKDNTFQVVRADRVLNKISRDNGHFIEYMNEIWRIMRPEGQFMIAVPYANSYLYYQDPLSINPLNEATFAYFDPMEDQAGVELYKQYQPKPWKICHISYTSNGMMEVLLEKRRV